MICLKPFTEEDFPRMINWINAGSEEEMFFWAGITFTFPIDEQQLYRYVSESDSEIYSIWTRDGLPCGHAAIRKIDSMHHSARIGKIYIAPPFRRQKMTPFILQTLLCRAFNILKLNRVALGVFADNQRAKKIYEEFGFHTEGVLREYRLINGRFVDLVEMSMLRGEFTKRCRTL